jgi:hypothetical protein
MPKNYYKSFLKSITEYGVTLLQIVGYIFVTIYAIEFWTFYMWRDAYEWWSLILGGLWSIITFVFNFLVGLFS